MRLGRKITNRIELRARLFEIIKERSFRRQRIRLASGRMSDYYLDMKPTLLDQEAASLLPRLILENLEDVQADGIGGLEMGAVPLIGPVIVEALSYSRPLFGFFVRKTPKDHGTMQLVESARDIAGKDLIVIDDVTTSGKSAMLGVEALQRAGAHVKLVLSIVDREEGAAELFRENGIPFRTLFRAAEFLSTTS